MRSSYQTSYLIPSVPNQAASASIIANLLRGLAVTSGVSGPFYYSAMYRCAFIPNITQQGLDCTSDVHWEMHTLDCADAIVNRARPSRYHLTRSASRLDDYRTVGGQAYVSCFQGLRCNLWDAVVDDPSRPWLSVGLATVASPKPRSYARLAVSECGLACMA